MRQRGTLSLKGIRGVSKGEGAVATGLQPPKSKFKNIHFVDTILNVLHGLPFSGNEQLKSANDYYILNFEK